MEGFNRQTIISFPNRSDISDLSTGIISGTLSIEEILCEKNIEFGAFNASKFEVQLYDFGDISNEAIEVYQLDNGIKKAIFTGIVDSCKKDSNGYYRDIVAYDSVYEKRDINIATWWKEFWKNKTTTNLKELRTSLLNYMQITYVNKDLFNDTLTFEKPADFDSIPFGTMLQAICQLQLCFPHVNRIGSLEFITLSTNKDEAITISESEFEKGNTTFEAYSTHVITRVQIYNGSNELVGIAGLEGNNYTISDNLFITAFNTEEVNTIAGSILNQLKDISLTPIEVTMLQSNLDFKLGDYVKVGNVYSYIMANSMSGIQLVEQTLKADADEYFSETTAYDANIQYYKDKINQVAHIMETDYLKTSVADIKYLSVDKQSVIEANIKEAVIQEADIKYATIENEKVINSKIDNLEVRYAEVITLNADVSNIKTLMFGSASGGSLTTEFSNSVVSLIGDAQIKSAMIESIAANKITSGKIYTNLVEILSESGNLDILDNTIQIKDDNKVTRVQIGKDANSDYNMYVWDKSGNLMFDALGLTENGVKREIIRNDMIKEDANIAASKLDIESLFNVINEDGSHTLKSSKIYVDANKQTLDVAFKDMTTNVTNLQNAVTTQGTQLTAVQGQISSKVWQQDISTAVNNLQIGGRNLFQGTKKFVFQNVIALDGVGGVIIAEQYKGLTVRLKTTAWNFYRPTINLEAGSYVFSAYAKGNTIYKVQMLVVDTVKQINIQSSLFSITGDWEKYYINFTIKEKTNVRFYFESTGAGDIYECGWKLEEGNKATDWTPAPEDIDVDISSVDTKVTTVSNQYTSLNQSLTSLTATVNSNTTKISEKADGSTVTALQANVTALTADLSGFKTSVSNTYATKTSLSDYAMVTAMNSAITQSASSILTTVSSNYATKASLELKVDKDKLISEINASADVITLKSNRFILDSTNAKIAADGTVNFTGGIIGGWTINKSALYSDYDKYRSYIQKSTSNDTWVYSTQVKINNNHYGTWHVNADGMMYIGSVSLEGAYNINDNKNFGITFYDTKHLFQGKPNALAYLSSGYYYNPERWSIDFRIDNGDSFELTYSINGDDPAYYANVLTVGYNANPYLMFNNLIYADYAGNQMRISNSDFINLINCELSLYGTGKVAFNWHVNGTIYGNVSSDSDKNIKKDIQALNIEDSARFIYSLIPSEFRFKNGTSNRLHHGLIAQEVKESMGEKDWGLFIDKQVEDTNYIDAIYCDKDKTTTELLTARYGLRYDELIADLIATVQSLNNRLKALEK
nr:MAG TPA: Neck appendage protein [Caudoviricetes sp.]